MQKDEMIKFIEKNKIIAICRGIYEDELLYLVEAISSGGIKLVEITFDQSDPECLKKTTAAIRLINERFKGKVEVGAGTVIKTEQVIEAYNAGAKYIISPNIDKEIIKLTNQLEMVSIPGGTTSTEILQADSLKADFVKLFPAGTLGVKYAKDLMGPINHVKLIATAGITAQNLPGFLALGFKGAGISSYLTSKDFIENDKLNTLKSHAIELTELAGNSAELATWNK